MKLTAEQKDEILRNETLTVDGKISTRIVSQNEQDTHYGSTSEWVFQIEDAFFEVTIERDDVGCTVCDDFYRVELVPVIRYEWRVLEN